MEFVVNDAVCSAFYYFGSCLENMIEEHVKRYKQPVQGGLKGCARRVKACRTLDRLIVLYLAYVHLCKVLGLNVQCQVNQVVQSGKKCYIEHHVFQSDQWQELEHETGRRFRRSVDNLHKVLKEFPTPHIEAFSTITCHIQQTLTQLCHELSNCPEYADSSLLFGEQHIYLLLDHATRLLEESLYKLVVWFATH